MTCQEHDLRSGSNTAQGGMIWGQQYNTLQFIFTFVRCIYSLLATAFDTYTVCMYGMYTLDVTRITQFILPQREKEIQLLMSTVYCGYSLTFFKELSCYSPSSSRPRYTFLIHEQCLKVQCVPCYPNRAFIQKDYIMYRTLRLNATVHKPETQTSHAV